MTITVTECMEFNIPDSAWPQMVKQAKEGRSLLDLVNWWCDGFSTTVKNAVIKALEEEINVDDK